MNKINFMVKAFLISLMLVFTFSCEPDDDDPQPSTTSGGNLNSNLLGFFSSISIINIGGSYLANFGRLGFASAPGFSTLISTF